MKKIYVKPINDVPITSLKVLINSLYTKESMGWAYANPTYSDKECTVKECFADRRSFEDLWCIAKTYFPETTEVELMKEMKEEGLWFRYCPDVWKLVFAKANAGFYSPISQESFQLKIEQNRVYVTGTYTAKNLLDICQKAGL